VAGGAASVGPRARALYAAGYLAWTQGDGQRAPALLEQSLALYRDLGDKRGLARTFNTLAALANEQSEYEKAALLLEEGLVFARDIEATDLMATLLNNHAETWLRAETSNRREPSINKHWLRFLLQAVRRAASCFSISAWWRVPKAIIPRHAPSTPEA
jgi:tetratricopeptide (TPR) repeat protein